MTILRPGRSVSLRFAGWTCDSLSGRRLMNPGTASRERVLASPGSAAVMVIVDRTNRLAEAMVFVVKLLCRMNLLSTVTYGIVHLILYRDDSASGGRESASGLFLGHSRPRVMRPLERASICCLVSVLLCSQPSRFAPRQGFHAGGSAFPREFPGDPWKAARKARGACWRGEFGRCPKLWMTMEV